ncbi:MAG: acylphosphatase [Gemmatimonadetes bacterium]|nr:acylphosphatase [Gemmatimonadota bacterium]
MSQGASAPETRRAFRVVGRVQGVGFRWWAFRHARELGLHGTVRNARDGSVELQVAGPPEAVERFRALMAAGPPGANVRGVEDLGAPDRPLPPTFEIVG